MDQSDQRTGVMISKPDDGYADNFRDGVCLRSPKITKRIGVDTYGLRQIIQRVFAFTLFVAVVLARVGL